MKCGQCSWFIGMGDWDLCCKKQVRRLCYENTESCDRFEQTDGGRMMAHPKICHGDHPPYPLFEGDAWSMWYVCSECGKPIDISDHYCKHCGVELSQCDSKVE